MAEGRFATARSRKWLQSELRGFNRKEVETIEKFGCQVLSVSSDGDSLDFAYTFGLFDTCGVPEIIEVGLPHKTAGALLNEAARRLRAGATLTDGRHWDLLGKVECEFRPVDPSWAKRLMLGATWYYEETDFPVIQAVYPDLENRFPGEDGFDLNFEQPLLQHGRQLSEMEEAFWRAHKPRA